MQACAVRRQDFRTRNDFRKYREELQKLSDKFLEKDARFKDLEEKLNEFVNSLKTNDASKNLCECPAPTTFDFKEVNNNDKSENIETELEETDSSYNFFTCSESCTDLEEIEITTYVEVPMSKEEEIDVASFLEVPMLTEDSESEIEDDVLIDEELEALVGKLWNNNPLYISMDGEDLSIHDTITEGMDTDEVRMMVTRDEFYYWPYYF